MFIKMLISNVVIINIITSHNRLVESNQTDLIDVNVTCVHACTTQEVGPHVPNGNLKENPIF